LRYSAKHRSRLGPSGVAIYDCRRTARVLHINIYRLLALHTPKVNHGGSSQGSSTTSACSCSPLDSVDSERQRRRATRDQSRSARQHGHLERRILPLPDHHQRCDEKSQAQRSPPAQITPIHLEPNTPFCVRDRPDMQPNSAMVSPMPSSLVKSRSGRFKAASSMPRTWSRSVCWACLSALGSCSAYVASGPCQALPLSALMLGRRTPYLFHQSVPHRKRLLCVELSLTPRLDSAPSKGGAAATCFYGAIQLEFVCGLLRGLLAPQARRH